MRILDENTTESVVDLIQAHEREADRWMPPKIFVVVKGASPEICLFVTRLKELAESVNWREVIWVRDCRKLTKRAAQLWFPNEPNACAVILGAGMESLGVLSSGSSRYAINIALLEAMQSRQAREVNQHPDQMQEIFECTGDWSTLQASKPTILSNRIWEQTSRG